MKLRLFLFLLFSTTFCFAQSKPVLSNKIAIDWYRTLLPLTRYSFGYAPTVASRSLAYISLALYETTIIPGNPRKSLATQLNGLVRPSRLNKLAKQGIHLETAINNAVWYMTERFYINTIHSIERPAFAFYNNINAKYKKNLPDAEFQRSVAYGKAVAEWIYKWSETDGGHQAFLKIYSLYYEPPICDSCWKSPFTFEKTLAAVLPIHPTWGDNRTFIPEKKINYSLSNPTPFSKDTNSQFYKEAIETYQLSERIANERKGDQFDIVRFWDDLPMHSSTPAGHSVYILTDIIENEKIDLFKAAEIYVQLTMAISDAFVLTWREKYKHNTVRPVTYIKELIDPNFRAVLVTPAFPEYPSGHSVQASVMAAILTANFGDNYPFKSTSSFELFNPKNHTSEVGEIKRTYKSFYEAAKEASLSRKLGGIHFETAGREGLKMGNQIGESYIKYLKFK